jgi:hypothetical protein
MPRYRRATSKSSTETSTLLNRVLDRAFSSANSSRHRVEELEATSPLLRH